MESYLALYHFITASTFRRACQNDLNAAKWRTKMASTASLAETPIVKNVGLSDSSGDAWARQSIHDTGTGKYS